MSLPFNIKSLSRVHIWAKPAVPRAVNPAAMKKGMVHAMTRKIFSPLQKILKMNYGVTSE